MDRTDIDAKANKEDDTMDNTIRKKEDEIFEEIIGYLNDSENFVKDGLCWADIKCGENLSPVDYKEMENLYMGQDKRVVFLLKEPNGNEGEDYRDWHWKENSTPLGRSIAFWLEGILKTTERYYPIKDELRQNREIFKERPFALVNVKKIAGGARSNWKEIEHYAEKCSEQIINQLNLYDPNIIVCCGSSDSKSKPTMLKLAKKYFYKDCSFNPINDFCYYCKDKNLLLIDSYHPSYTRVKNEDKFDKMFECYSDFLKKQDK
jgi:hypothetical protein